jgi:hypothetical protein
LSKTAVSQLGERLWEDYQAFAKCDLSEYEIIYLFVDGIAERLCPGAKREPVLAAWGFTVEGRRVLSPAPALPSASYAQPGDQSARGRLARVQGTGASGVSGTEPRHCPRACRRRRCRLLSPAGPSCGMLYG